MTEVQARLVVDHFSIVHRIARQMWLKTGAHLSLDDLVGEGVFGLLDAARNYDPLRRVPFVGFAKFRVRGAMLDWIRSNDWLGRRARDHARDQERATRDLEARHGRAPTKIELATELGFSLQQLDALSSKVHRSSPPMSLDASPDDDSSNRFVDLLVDLSVTSAEEALLAAEEIARAQQALNQLPERQQIVLRGIFFEGLTLKQVAERVGIVGQYRVWQLKMQALNNLRKMLNT